MNGKLVSEISSEDSSENLIVDIRYLDDMANFFRMTADKAELALNDTLESLKGASECLVISGEMAKALKAYIETLSQMQGKIHEFAQECSNSLAESFGQEIIDLDPPVSVG